MSYKCLSLVMLDSVAEIKKKCYPQTLLEECKYERKKTKMEHITNDDLKPSSSFDKTESDPDNETDNDESKY